ncbi:MAG: anthranilate synthase component I family protein, partial [Myxococcota bacterium]
MPTTLHQRELHADLETPVSAYLKLRPLGAPSFLFESVEGSERWARYSILGVGARRTFTAREGAMDMIDAAGRPSTHVVSDALNGLRALQRLDAPLSGVEDPPFVGGVFGYLAYDAVRRFERLPGIVGPPSVPDAYFVEPQLLVVFDNRRHTLTMYAEERAQIEKATQALRSNLPPFRALPSHAEFVARDRREDFCAAVERAKESIRAGDIIQVVLSRRFELTAHGDPFHAYRGLRTINPSPYLFYFETPGLALAGASPEVMVRVQQGDITVRPIAGTRPRGRDGDEDDKLAADLLADAKERAEHLMLVDLGRNDVGRVSLPGSVRVPSFMQVEKYSHVLHLVSEVRGRLAPTYDCYDALRAAFPAGTLSGAPKVRAMQIIDELEGRRRGIYGGAVGYVGPRGDADFGIAIRTLEAHGD